MRRRRGGESLTIKVDRANKAPHCGAFVLWRNGSEIDMRTKDNDDECSGPVMDRPAAWECHRPMADRIVNEARAILPEPPRVGFV